MAQVLSQHSKLKPCLNKSSFHKGIFNFWSYLTLYCKWFRRFYHCFQTLFCSKLKSSETLCWSYTVLGTNPMEIEFHLIKV